MTKDCIYNVETLVAKYLDDKDKNHYSKPVGGINLVHT